jgi:glutathione synthase
MKLLVLTDHAGHSQHNSVYALVRALIQQSDVQSIHACSRSDNRNKLFFEGKGDPHFWAITCDETFAYPAHELFDQKTELYHLQDFDSIFLRLPRPIHPAFFDFLSHHFDERQIVNRPSGIKKTGSKAFLLNFDQYVAPMKLCLSWNDIRLFANEYVCVLKPLEDYGGRGIVRIDGETVNQNGVNISRSNFYRQYQDYPRPYLAMKYLKHVSAGDKRIVVAGGEVLTCSLRRPAKDNWLCNVAQGGSDEMATPDERELAIIEYIQPKLKAEGIFYYGLDTLMNDDGQRVISEINTLSIGGIAPGEITSGRPLAQIFARNFVAYLKNNHE